MIPRTIRRSSPRGTPGDSSKYGSIRCGRPALGLIAPGALHEPVPRRVTALKRTGLNCYLSDPAVDAVVGFGNAQILSLSRSSLPDPIHHFGEEMVIMKKAVLGLLALGASMLGASPAAAVPPPDHVYTCPGNPSYQIHQWNMLGGIPNYRAYFRVLNWPDYMSNPNGVTPILEPVPQHEFFRKCFRVEQIMYDKTRVKPGMFLPKPDGHEAPARRKTSER